MRSHELALYFIKCVKYLNNFSAQGHKIIFLAIRTVQKKSLIFLNPLTPNDPYMGRTAPLTSKHCILYIYSTNICTEYFKHALYSPFFFLSSKFSLFHNANLFGSCIIHILYTECAKIKKKNNPGAKGLILEKKPCTLCTGAGLDERGKSRPHRDSIPGPFIS